VTLSALKPTSWLRGIFTALSLTFACAALAGEAAKSPALIKPAKTTGTGLLLEPDLDLSKFTTKEFTALSSSVGTNRIHKKWTNAVATLPAHERADARGLTTNEVKAYMAQVKQIFKDGEAIPVSDTGLISTQEDVIRRPMLNHIAAFSNAVARVYLLVQKTSTDKDWGYFSIVQDMTLDPPLDYFADLNGKEARFEGHGCYKCHSSGPLAIHPAREDLEHIAKQPLSNFYFPPNETKPDYGQPLALDFCSKCHDTDGKRQPLYKVHFHPMRILTDYGYMPPKHPLTPEQILELKAWLDEKPHTPAVEAKQSGE
jgi:hypothetical protein